MINRTQHLMILCLYAFFSIFLGIIFITLSDSFYVGAGSFFAFFLSFVCYHIFWLGRKVIARISNMSTMIHTLDSNKKNAEQDLKSVRDIINNVTEIINTLINSNTEIEDNISQTHEKNNIYFSNLDAQISLFNTKIQTLEGKNDELSALLHKLSTQAAQAPQTHTKPYQHTKIHQEYNDTFITDDFMTPSNMMDIRTVNNEKSIYDARYSADNTPYIPQPKSNPKIDDDHNFSDDFYATKQSGNAPNTNDIFSFDEDGFLNLGDDDDFSDLTLPQTAHLNHSTQKPPEQTANDDNQKDNNSDNEFSTIDQKTTDSYRHLLEADHDETFYETIDDYHTKIIREQINTPDATAKPQETPQETENPFLSEDYTDAEEDDDSLFSDITHNFPESTPSSTLDIAQTSQAPIDNSDVIPTKQKQSFTPTTDAIPSLVDLVPDEKLKHLVKRQKLIKTTIPTLDDIINKPLIINKKNVTLSSDISDYSDEEFTDTQEAEKTYFNEDTQASDSEKGTANKSHKETHETTSQNNFIDTIRTAIETNNVTLFTCPVTDYRVREVKFFENYLYVPNGHNTFIPHSDFVPLARKKSLGIAIDRLMITHSIKLSHHLKHDISDVGVFCNISLFSVTDPHFESELYGLLHDKKQINQHLIFNFTQEELQLLNSIQIEKMLHLVDMGIRFCVDNIHNVLPDLSELSRIGISFIKIRPIDFVKGIYANHAIYKGKDIKEICQKANILLCVKNIDDHESLLSAVENQADLLQGDLLGEKERSELLESYAV